MSAVYFRPGKSAEEETSRLDVLTDTLITTLSQDNLFIICLMIVELLGATFLLLCFLSMLQMGGFSLQSTLIFNYHPMLMSVGMLFLNANGILVYRSLSNLSYSRQKLVHFSVQSSAIAISWLGFVAAYVSHERGNIPHFYSLHSWLGLVALIGVSISLVTSYLTFMWPKASGIYRRLALPFHVFGGIVNIALSASICGIGITEKAIFVLNKSTDPSLRYAALPSVAVLFNSLGIVLATFTILVVWMVTKPEFKPKARMTVNGPHFALRREKTLS